MSWVFEHSRSKKNARLVLLAIGDHANDDGGGAYPSMPKLQHKTGLSERAVTGLVADLERMGELEVKRNAGPRGCNLYRVIMTPQILHPADSAGVRDEDSQVKAETPASPAPPAESAPPQEATANPAESAPGTIKEPSEISSTKRSSTSRKSRRGSKPKDTERLDVERICNHLADRVEANGCKRPKINQDWRDAARRLIDLDGRTEGQIIRCIDWATTDEFWHKNILSMPTLRKQYDRLRLDAEAKRRQANGRASPRSQLVERNGMQLKPETAARLDDRARFEAMDRALSANGTAAIEGPK